MSTHPFPHPYRAPDIHFVRRPVTNGVDATLVQLYLERLCHIRTIQHSGTEIKR